MAARRELTVDEFALLGMEVPTAEHPRVRKKVPLGKGFGPLDWAKLSKTLGPGMPGAPSLQIPLAELEKHNKPDDCWMALHGKVYNITGYLPFHPGGPAILEKVAGQDATAFFLYFHSFVNYQKLLENCQLGILQH